MAEHIAEVIFIDMERSEVDEERSKPTKGVYFFKGEPELITPDSYRHEGHLISGLTNTVGTS